MNRRFLTTCCALTLAIGSVAAVAAQTLAPPPFEGSNVPEPLCEDGVVKDDGSLETGWGWVPTVIEGEYAQVFDSSEFPTSVVASVCVCWLRTEGDNDIDFEVVFYRAVVDLEGDLRPADEPYVAVPATATGVPQGIVGAFVEVEVPAVRIPFGEFYIGVRWNPSADRFFFVCADTTPETPRTNLFFRDDRASGWDNAFDTTDPLFLEHRAILVRAQPRPDISFADVPALDAAGLGVLGLLLAAIGVGAVRRRASARG